MDFYNENEFRDYPFLGRHTDIVNELPQSAVVDFGATMGPASRFLATDSVYLHRVERTGDTITFDFRSTSLPSERCLFTREIDSAEYLVDWRWSTQIGAYSESSGSLDSGRWRAFLVTGKLDELAELLDGDAAIVFDPEDWVVEPARIHNLSGSRVTNLNLANELRQHVTAPESCDSYSEGADEITATAVELRGDLKFADGYNASVRQDDLARRFTLAASKGAGAGESCEEVPRYPGESPPAGSPFLSGGPGCNELIKSVNGVGGKDIKVRGGPGVLVFPHASLPHTLVIRFLPEAFRQ